MLKGWISVPCDVDTNEEQKYLEQHGIKVGFYNENDCTFYDCDVTENGLNELNNNFGYYVWGLE